MFIIIKNVWKFAFLLIAFSLLIALSIYFAPVFAKYMQNPIQFAEYVRSFGNKSILIFIGFQIIQVIIAVLPGEITQLAGGFVYGTLLGTLLSYIGITLGMIIVFFLVRLFGMPLVRMSLSDKQMEKFKFLLNRPDAELAIFILFIIPGIPKDVLTYIAGLTPLHPLRFILFASLARLPGIFLSSYIGAHLEKERYFEAIVVSILAAILFVIGLLFRERIKKNFIKNVD